QAVIGSRSNHCGVVSRESRPREIDGAALFFKYLGHDMSKLTVAGYTSRNLDRSDGPEFPCLSQTVNQLCDSSILVTGDKIQQLWRELLRLLECIGSHRSYSC